MCAGDILYVLEGFSPRRTYFRTARRANRARVLYDFSACEARFNAVKYVFSANTVLILIQYFLGQISVLNLTEFFIARN